MRAAGLEVVADVTKSQAVMIKNNMKRRTAAVAETHNQLINMLVMRIRGHLTAQRYMFVVYNVSRQGADAQGLSPFDKCLKITPGVRSPTVTELLEPGWVSISAMIKKSDLHFVMDRLVEAGAVDILAYDVAASRSGGSAN